MTPPRTVGRQSYPYDRPGLTEEEVRRIARAEARALLVSVEARNVYPPRSIPLRSVDSIPVVTALTEGVDGDEVYYDTGLGFFWHFRYKADEQSAYRWVSVGEQTPLYDYVAALESTSLTAPTTLTTPGPELTIPLAGDWRMRFGASVQNNGGNSTTVSMAPSVNGGTPVEADGVSVFNTVVGTNQADCVTEREYLAQAAGTTLSARYWISFGSGVNGYFRGRFFSLYPVRVGSA